MTVFTVVPFLLGMTVAPETLKIKNISVNEKHFMYVFQVELTSKFSYPRCTAPTVKNITTQFAVNLTCQCGTPNARSMICHLGTYNNIQPIPIERPVSRYLNFKDKTLDFFDFYYDSPPFEIMFVFHGVSGYYVEFDSIPMRLMNVYRMIGNELNIGVNLKRKGNQDSFTDEERSHIGYCSTEYKIQRKPTLIHRWPNLGINLTSFVDLDLKNETVVITKQRNIIDCKMLQNYSLSMKLWPEYLPTTAVRKSLINSTNTLSMCSLGMESLSENVFNLYDYLNNEVGYVTETIILELKSYRELPASHVFAFDKKKTGQDKVVLVNQIINDL